MLKRIVVMMNKLIVKQLNTSLFHLYFHQYLISLHLSIMLKCDIISIDFTAKSYIFIQCIKIHILVLVY